jgi:hypothetical protein
LEDLIKKIQTSQTFQLALVFVAVSVIGFAIYNKFFSTNNFSGPISKGESSLNSNSKELKDIDPLKPSFNDDVNKENLKVEINNKKDPNSNYIPNENELNTKLINNSSLVDFNNIFSSPEETVNNKLKSTYVTNEKKLENIKLKNKIEDLEKKINSLSDKKVKKKELNPFSSNNEDENPFKSNKLNKKNTELDLQLYTYLSSDSIADSNHYNFNNGVLLVETNNSSDNVTNTNVTNINELSNRIKAGSSFYAELLTPINSLYPGLKVIAEISTKELGKITLIGTAVPNSNSTSMTIQFNELITENNKRESISAIGINAKNLTPGFVDNLDTKFFPRLSLALLGSVVDTLATFGSINVNLSERKEESATNPMIDTGKTLLSSEINNQLNYMNTEIKVNQQNFIVMFY